MKDIFDANDISDIPYEKTGVARSGICNCCKGKRLSSGGYQWKYKEKGEPKCTKCSET